MNNKKRVEIRWKRHHEKQEWQKEAEEAEETIEKGLKENESISVQKNSNPSKVRVL